MSDGKTGTDATPEPDESGDSGPLAGFRRGYRDAGVILLNTVLLVLLLNVVLGGYYLVHDALDETAREEPARLFTEEGAPVDNGRRMEDHLRWYDFSALEGIAPEYAGRMLDDFYELSRAGFIYQSWVQFSSPPFDGDLVHVDVDERGFPHRRTVRSVTRPDTDSVVRIVTLGGSTTFGENVSDEHTWPSHLADILAERARTDGYPHRVEVVNYGRPFYHPAQQLALLVDLLQAGHRPSVVISMDGVNLGAAPGEPHFKPEVAEAFITRQHGDPVTRAEAGQALRWVPMVRLALEVDHWLDRRGRSGGEASGGGVRDEVWEERVHRATHRFGQYRRLADGVCDVYGCEFLAFLQPNALEGYDFDLYRIDPPEAFTSRADHFREFYRTMRRDTGYIDLSHLFDAWGEDRKALVDELHYTPGFNRFLARHVAERIELAELPVFESVVDEKDAAASPRSLVTRRGWLAPEEDWRLPGDG